MLKRDSLPEPSIGTGRPTFHATSSTSNAPEPSDTARTLVNESTAPSIAMAHGFEIRMCQGRCRIRQDSSPTGARSNPSTLEAGSIRAVDKPFDRP